MRKRSRATGPQARTERVQFMASVGELQMIERQAAREGVSISEFVWTCMKGCLGWQ